jgi:hypothetical protein
LLRQIAQLNLVGHHSCFAATDRAHVSRCKNCAGIPSGLPQGASRIELEFDRAANVLERVAEEVSRALDRSKQVAQHWKAAAGDAGKQHRRSAPREHAPLDFRNFPAWVHGIGMLDQLFSAP